MGDLERTEDERSENLDGDQPADPDEKRNGRTVVVIFGIVMALVAVLMFLVARSQSYPDSGHDAESLHVRGRPTS